MKKLHRHSLHEQVREELLAQAKESGCYRLAPEEDLAKELGVSRTTIREALNTLQREKVLIKRKRVGNLLLKSALEAKNRLDLHGDFTLMIEELGKEPSLKAQAIGFAAPSEGFLRSCPHYATENETYHLNWTFFADEEPAVLCLYELPKSLILKEAQDEFAKGKEAIYQSNSAYKMANQDTTHYMEKVRAKLSDVACKQLHLKPGEPLICFEQTSYNLQELAFAYTEIYFNPNIIELTCVMPYLDEYWKP